MIRLLTFDTRKWKLLIGHKRWSLPIHGCTYPNPRISHRSATTWLSYFKHCHSPRHDSWRGAKLSAPFIYLRYSKEAFMDVPWTLMWRFWNQDKWQEVWQLGMPIRMTLVSEQTFAERQLFNLVAAISAYTTIEKDNRARICSAMQSPWNPKMRRWCLVDSADMWQRVCTGQKITGWGLVRRLGITATITRLGGVGRVEDLDDLHFQTTSCLCPSHTSRTLEKKVLGWLQGLGWLVGMVHRYREYTKIYKAISGRHFDIFSCFRKLLHAYPSLQSSLIQ